MRAHARFAYPPRDEPSRVLRGDAVELSLGRIEVTYPAPGEPPRIAVAGQPLSIENALPAMDTATFALAAGSDSILISDRDEKLAMLVPRDGSSPREAQAPASAAGMWTGDGGGVGPVLRSGRDPCQTTIRAS